MINTENDPAVGCALERRVRGDAQFVEAVTKWRLDAGGTELHLVLNNGKAQAAYPRKLQAEIYASGFSKNDGVKIISGTFTPNVEGNGRPNRRRSRLFGRPC
ncbi:MAG: hypothetical protein U1C96_07995 [Gallionella sp.]|nr:hypothetical protein [Gallionella sp.]